MVTGSPSRDTVRVSVEADPAIKSPSTLTSNPSTVVAAAGSTGTGA